LDSRKIEINHASSLLLDEIDQQSVADVMDVLPPAVREKLKELAAKMPRTDTEWDQWIDLSVSCAVYDPSVTREQLVQMECNSKRAKRRSIQALREHFAISDAQGGSVT
jgi:hypothetical protein